ncbi:MAG TPA: CHAT domain-containing protein [Thermoanaerobaculia bacterium]
MEHSAFPSDETLAAFIDGRLDEETRKRVVAHVADCEECYGTVMASGALQHADEKPLIVSRLRSWKALSISSRSIAAAAVIAMVIFRAPLRDRYRDYTYERRTGIRGIVDAANLTASRDIAGRLSGPFEYKPLVILRGPGDDSDKWSLKGAAGALRSDVGRDASADKLHGLGVAHLLVGEYDAAVDALEDALAKETGEANSPRAIAECRDARLLTDLSAAYAARSADTHSSHDAPGSSQDALAADDAAERAWALEQSPQAAWNRAIAAESMHARPLAIQAWRDYLALDSSSRWSAEARDHLSSLTATRGAEDWPSAKARMVGALGRGENSTVADVVRSFYPQSRSYLEDELLPRLAQDASDRSTAAIVDGLARAISDVFGDRTVIDSLPYLKDPLVAAAVAEFGAARKNRSLPLDHIATTLVASGVPLGGRAQVFAAFSTYYAHHYSDAIDKARAARSTFGIDHFPSVVAQSLWIEGLALASERKLGEANAALSQAITLFSKLNDPRSIAGLDGVISDNYRLAGDPRSALTALIDALAVREASGWDIDYICFSDLAKTCDLMGSRSATLAFLDAALRRAAADHSAAETTDALVARAELRHASGDDDSALTDIHDAEREITGVKSDQDRVRLNMYLDVVVGNALARRSPRQALQHLVRAVSVAKALGSPEHILMALYGRGVAERTLGNEAQAVATLKEAFVEAERQRKDIDGDDTRVSLVDFVRPVEDELVRSFIETGHGEEALLWSERAKGRVTLDSARAHGVAVIDPVTVSDLAESVEPSTNYVEFQVLPDAVAIWTVGAGKVGFQLTRIRKTDLESRIRSLSSAAFRGDDILFARVSTEIYSMLISPVEDYFAGDQVTLIPDAVLTSVPWPALKSPKTGERLGGRYALAVAPSITWCISRKSNTDKTPLSRIAIVVGGSDGGLRALPEAEADAERLASLFVHHETLAGNVTDSDVRRSASAQQILHFAGHADHDALLVGRPPHRLDLGTIRGIDFSRVRLITLAACATSRGRATSDGSMSLARAFLVGNAPSVLATNTPIDDWLASRLSEAFYRRLPRSEGIADALRAARLDICQSPANSTTQCWAAFQVWGVAA